MKDNKEPYASRPKLERMPMLSRGTVTLCEIHKVGKNLFGKDFKYSPLASPSPDATRVDCTIQQVHLGKPKHADQLESHYTYRGWTTPSSIDHSAQRQVEGSTGWTARWKPDSRTVSPKPIWSVAPRGDPFRFRDIWVGTQDSRLGADTSPDGSRSNYRKLPDHILTRPGRDAA